ncbi:unnamed protein product [Eruca vesicaria subsp. sativa]|uniref:TFIIF beta subunit HTH domain-containing protein n=1 Tax=Eruca vesicaria subsp. sativa TaxID=29727 RepID=A0ABC8LMT4_ERUVS|nr:unnamed protein product [Eruca vesicaria subsp. sativa]
MWVGNGFSREINAVSSSLRSLPFPDDPYLPLPKVIVSIDPLAFVDDDTKVVMELARAEFGNIPKRYALDMYKDSVLMFVFGDLSVEGKIKNICDMRLHNETLRAMDTFAMKEQTSICAKANCSRSMKIPLECVCGHWSMISPTAAAVFKIQHLKPLFKNTVNAAYYSPEKKKVVNKTLEMKRTRRDRGEMEEQFLKDLLRDLCIYNNKGSNQGTYELKPEYKKVPQE